MLRILEARGASCNVPEKNPGKFYRLFGGDEMIITLEYLDKPANVEVFNQALTSPVTKIVTPDIGERLTRHRSHILIEVAHGVLGVYELEPLLNREFGFQSDAYVPRERAFDDRTPPPDLMPRGDDARMVLDNEWRERRALAEGIGGRLEVRSRDGHSPDSTPPPTPLSPLPWPPRFGLRPVFGRKNVGG